MPRKTEMPEDVRRMIAEIRSEYDDPYDAYVKDVTKRGDIPNDGPIQTLTPEMAALASGKTVAKVGRNAIGYVIGKVKDAVAERAKRKALDKVFNGAGIDWGKYRKAAGKYLGRELPDYEKIARDEKIGAINDGLVDALRGAKVEPTKIKDALGNTIDLRVGLKELGSYAGRKAVEVGVQQATIPRQASKGGDAPGESKSSAVPKGHNPALDGYSGPRVVINPQVMKDDRDALCVAFNESFRIIQEINGFDPVAEPTEKQRAFFADTAYRDDERMLRRTILSRICTFDTSVTDPTDEQLQEAVEFLDTVLEIGAPQNQWEQRAVERIRTAISQALESGERVPASQAPAPEDSPEVAAGGAGSSAGGVPKDEEKDSGAEFRENARAQMDEAAKLAQDGPTAEERKMQAMAEAAGEAAGDDPFGKSAEMKAAAQEAGFKADIAEAQKPENLMQKNGHYVDAQGRVISERAAKALAEQDVRNAAVQDTNNQQQQAPGADMDAAQNSPRTDSGRIGVSSGIKGHGGRELTAGESAWMARRQASTAAWMQRTGRSGDGVADALAQRDERANGLFQNRRVDSGRRDALGRKLDDRGRVIA